MPAPDLLAEMIPPDVRDRLARAAERRAGGASWESVARQLDADPADLKALTREHAREYGRHYALARREVMRESLAEAVFALRRMLRSGEPRDARHAAEC